MFEIELTAKYLYLFHWLTRRLFFRWRYLVCLLAYSIAFHNIRWEGGTLATEESDFDGSPDHVTLALRLGYILVTITIRWEQWVNEWVSRV